MRRLVTGLLAIVGLAVGFIGISALREATLSTHQSVHHASLTRLEIKARAHGAERGQSLEEMVEAHLLSCRLEVSSDIVGRIRPLGDGKFAAVLRPAMDETNRRQFRGCVEDFSLDHVQIDVLVLTGDEET